MIFDTDRNIYSAAFGNKRLGLYEKYGFSRCGDPELGYAFKQPIPHCYEMIREAGFETINE